jgi:hypothetical protein
VYVSFSKLRKMPRQKTVRFVYSERMSAAFNIDVTEPEGQEAAKNQDAR